MCIFTVWVIQHWGGGGGAENVFLITSWFMLKKEQEKEKTKRRNAEALCNIWILNSVESNCFPFTK